MVEGIFNRLLDDTLGFGGGQPVFRLSLEFGLPHENREHAAGAGHDIVAGNRGSAFFLSDTSGVVFQPAQECRPQTGFVCPAVGRRDCVAVGVEEAVGVGSPGTAHSTAPCRPVLPAEPVKMSG